MEIGEKTRNSTSKLSIEEMLHIFFLKITLTYFSTLRILSSMGCIISVNCKHTQKERNEERVRPHQQKKHKKSFRLLALSHRKLHNKDVQRVFILLLQLKAANIRNQYPASLRLKRETKSNKTDKKSPTFSMFALLASSSTLGHHILPLQSYP